MEYCVALGKGDAESGLPRLFRPRQPQMRLAIDSGI